MSEKTLTQLIAQAIDIMYEQNYDDRIIKHDTSVWRRFLKSCDTKGYNLYSPSHKEEYIA